MESVTLILMSIVATSYLRILHSINNQFLIATQYVGYRPIAWTCVNEVLHFDHVCILNICCIRIYIQKAVLDSKKWVKCFQSINIVAQLYTSSFQCLLSKEAGHSQRRLNQKKSRLKVRIYHWNSTQPSSN